MWWWVSNPNVKDQSLKCRVAVVNALATNGDTPLHVAMRLPDENRCLIITKLLVEAGFSPCELDADDKPPIQAAVTRGYISVVEYLLSRNISLPLRVLFAALQTTLVKRVEMIRLLVSKGANVHVLKPNGDTLLHIIMRSPDRSVCLEIAEIFIDVGCNPSALNSRGETPLHIAAKQGYHEMVNYLILFNPSSDTSSLLHNDPAVQVPTLRSLIGNTEGLHFSPEEEAGVMQVVRQFLDAQDKCLELTKTFIDVVGCPFARSSGCATLFDVAVRRGFNEVVEYLTSKAVPLPSSILFTALRYQVSMIPSLVCKGAQIHVQKISGDTILHVAMSGLEETQCRTTTQILVEAGCNPFALNIANKQPVHLAISRGFKSVVQYLLSHAFNAEMTSLPPDALLTALQCQEKLSMVRLLVGHGADVSHVAPNGDHLLHVVLDSLALEIGEDECLEITRLLCEAGCNSSAPNALGKTPLHIVITRGFTSIVDYLVSRDVPLPSDILFFALDSQPSKIWYKGDTYDWITIIHSLVRHGADVHTQDPNRNTLLHRVMRMESESHCVALTIFFVDAGCNPSARNADGKLPIEVAVTHAFPSVVEYLLSRHTSFPSDILLTVLKGQNAFSREVLRMTSSFIEHGADVCAIATNGNTVIHVALLWETRWVADYPSRLLDVVHVLVEAGCNIRVRDAEGRTSLELAVAMGYCDVAEYLKRSWYPGFHPQGIPR